MDGQAEAACPALHPRRAEGPGKLLTLTVFTPEGQRLLPGGEEAAADGEGPGLREQEAAAGRELEPRGLAAPADAAAEMHSPA